MPNFNLNGASIDIDGLGLGDCQPVITFPSGLIEEGQPGRDLAAALIQLNASFGFNTTPHTFQTSWVPTRDDPQGFHGASGQVPPVGSIIGFTVNDFLVSGQITHSEYNIDATGGTIVSISLSDTRRCLNKISLVTEDLGDNPGQSGVISVARAVRITQGFEDLEGNISEDKFREYRKVLELGCTYPQVLDAIQLAIDEGHIEFDITSIPTVDDLAANLGGNASAIRFKFDGTRLSDALTQILQASSYDWYWSMSDHSVNLVNRKIGFDLQESELLDIVASLGAVSGLDQTIRLQYGDDLVDQSRRVRLLGAHQEGFINSPILSEIDGLDTIASGLVFEPAWGNLTVQFTDAYGILRSYKPTDLELQAALKGIEHWTYFKKYQTAANSTSLESPGFGLGADAGSIAAQHPDFESRIDPAQPFASLGGNESGTFRLINNRRDQQQNWVLNFYSRVRSHADRFYGKAYIASGILADVANGAYKLASAAWANVENQVEGQVVSTQGSSGLFVNDYEINRDLGVFAPFKGTDDRISAHAILPSGTQYGPEADEPPAGFGQWTEDYFFAIDPYTNSIINAGTTTTDGSVSSAIGRRARTGEHYIPVTLTEVGQLTIDPRDALASFEAYPEGSILAELPIIASSGLSTNATFTNLVTLVESALEASSSGLDDTVNPYTLVEPYGALSGIAVPVIATRRYGMEYPGAWASGNLSVPCDSEEVVIDDQFGPWNFPPQGRTTSVQLMTDRATRRLQGLIAPASASTYAQVELVGLPKISFDGFSNQLPDSNGDIGVRNHGITSVNFSLGTNGIRSNYQIASFFSQFGQEAPLGERQRSILNGIITPVDTSQVSSPLVPSTRSPSRPTAPPTFVGRLPRGEVTRKVTITAVNNALTFFSTPDVGSQERYRGSTEQGYAAPPTKPGSDEDDFKGTGGAICIDGFLNIGDEAIYHVNEFKTENGRREVRRYFTGGRSFSNGTVVYVSGVGSNNDVYDVALQNTNPVRKLVDVPLLNGNITPGELTSIVAQADSSTPRVLSRPDTQLNIEGIYINPGGGNVAVPVIVTSVTSPGTSGALCSVRPLNSLGDEETAVAITGAVVPLPHPEFVIAGDKGTVTRREGTNFFMGNRQSFIRFS
jgi:hypothetical protein